jgi:hypothetical protein
VRTRASRAVLAGRGHSNAEVLRRCALRPAPDVELVPISPSPRAAGNAIGVRPVPAFLAAGKKLRAAAPPDEA